METALDDGDLEGHLCALVLHSGYHSVSPWTAALAHLRRREAFPARLHRPTDVAILGARLALGAADSRRAEFADLARRELRREPLSPAACVRDDTRLLLGVAAGIGAAAPSMGTELVDLLEARAPRLSIGQRALDLWAESLASGSLRLTKTCAERALERLRSTPVDTSIADTDWFALHWLATRLLEVPFEPTAEDSQVIDRIAADARRALPTVLARKAPLSPLNAALAIDALSVGLVERSSRRSLLEQVLRVIDTFPASAEVLAKRLRKKPPFPVEDEYDVQDLFRALVLPLVPDIVPEDPAAKVAGRSSRLDFTSRETRLGFEIKLVDSRTRARSVRNEILLDEATYQEHSYIDRVLVFVHDPEGHLPRAERTSFEADLSGPRTIRGRTVEYITRVR